MKNSRGGRHRYWRSLRCRIHASARRSAESGGASGQTARVRVVGGKTEASGVGARDAKVGETNARPASESREAIGESVATAMQAAIGLLTASLDSPELEARALPVLIPHDADGLGDLMAGLHLISELMIYELHEATGEPPDAILQRLALLAEHRRGMPSTG
jgi:hypothetical protein